MRPFLSPAVALLVLAGCSSMPTAMSSAMPTDLKGMANSIASLTGDIGKWATALGSGNIADAALEQLAGFSGQAGSLGSALAALLGGDKGKALDPNTKQLAGNVQSGLGKMSGFKLEDLLKLAQPERMAQVDSFAAASTQVGDLAKKLMAALGG